LKYNVTNATKQRKVCYIILSKMKTGVLRIIVLYVMYAFWLVLISDSYFRCTLVDISRNVYDHVRTNVHYADKCTGATTSIAVINSFVQI